MKKITLIWLLFVLSLVIARVSAAQSYGIPKTGQENVYHDSSENDRGDDGVIQAGFPLGSRRILAFQDIGSGRIFDRATGLIWQKKDSFSEEFGGRGGLMNWTDAFSYVAAMNSQGYGGHYDWRVPNIKELSSLINQGTWLPSLYYIFDSMQSASYWSSTSLEIQGSQRAYHILFVEGFVQFAYPDSSEMYVKAVRSYLPGSGVMGFPKSGQTTVFHAAAGNDKGDDGETRSGFPMTGDSYTDNQNGTITQNATGMFWQQSDSATQSFGGYSGPLTWEEGFIYISQMNAQAFAGYTDWRMPNYFELISLLDFGYFWPIMGPLFNPEKEPYWSSTNRFGVTPPTFAWTVSWASGWGNPYSKSEAYYIRAVRGGPVVTPSPIPPQPSPTPYPRYGVAKTGQIVSYHSGDDGAKQVGYPVSGARFADNGTTVTDHATGLIWQKGDSESMKTWENAFAYVATLNASGFAGYSDWRLPNIKELGSLVDFGKDRPAISSIFFGTRTDGGYWGSTTYADLVNGRRCYQITFNEGIPLFVNMDTIVPPSGYVRAVRSLNPEIGNWGFPRSGQTNILHFNSGYDLGDDGTIQAGYPANPGGRFLDNEDGTVTDRASGLIWQKTDSNYLPVGPYRSSLTWEDAFSYVEEMNIRKVGGYSHWRLPNFHELMSLLDFSIFYPALSPEFLFSIQPGLHWTSSSRNLDQGDSRWAINLTNGDGTFYDGAAGTAYVIAVMGGPGQEKGPQVTTPTPGYGPTPEWGPTPPPAPPPPPIEQLYYGLAWTGQTSVYHNAATNDMGDDGVTRIGYPADGVTRWEDTGNGTVIDWATGLMWQKSCSHGETFGGLKDTMTWDDAFNYVARINYANYGGYSNWRLPNCLELASTRNLENEPSTPSIFIDTAPDPYWSSTCSAGPGDTMVFRLSYSHGQILMGGITDNVLSGVRACRSIYDGSSPIGFPRTGQTEIIHPTGWYDLGDDGANRAGFPHEGDRYSDNGDGTVTDNATGLIWQQSSSTAQVTWEEAFTYVKGLNQQNFSGKSDWRLPSQMELYSIVDYGNYYPTIHQVFAATQPGLHWSSNTQGYKAHYTNAWAINFAGGVGDIYPKTNQYYVRAVRGDPVIPGYRPAELDYLIFGSGDYNGDGAADIAIFRSSSGLWAVRGITRAYFGSGTDTPIPGDYNGDGRSDIGIFRATSGLWAVLGITRVYFGSSADAPIPGDYNGDGSCDIGIFREGSGLWAIQGVTRAYFGGNGDQPVPGDYNGNGLRDISIFRASSGLWALRSISRIYFGSSTDKAIPGNYDGTGGWEVGIFRPSSGLWAIHGVTRAYFGSSSDQPIPGDYDGSGPDDLGIFRGASGLWAIRGVTRVYFGSSSDIPVSR